VSIIQITDLKKQYNSNYVLKGINLSIDAGQIVGYIGPNGAGKSTTIKILTGIIGDFEGDATLMGLDVRKNPIEIKQKIGYIPEQAALYDVLTPLEYLSFVGKLYQMEDTVIEKKSMDLLHLFELRYKAKSRINGYIKG